MKTLQIDAILKDFAGEDILGVDGPLTTKSMLLQCVGAFFTSPSPEENIEANRVGQKLYDSEGSIELEDAEFKLLNKAVNKTLKDQRYSVMIMTPILQLMESIKA